MAGWQNCVKMLHCINNSEFYRVGGEAWGLNANMIIPILHDAMTRIQKVKLFKIDVLSCPTSSRIILHVRLGLDMKREVPTV